MTVETSPEGKLLELAGLVANASGHNRWLDARIAAALRIGTEHSWAQNFPAWKGRADGRVYVEDGGPSFAAPYYTASLDAATTLVPRGWNVGQWLIIGKPDSCRMWDDARDIITSSATPALALTAACLRARAHTTKGTDDV